MRLNCLLIEDEPLALLRLKEYVERVPFLRLHQAFDNGLEAIPTLQNESIDLLFLDIEMDGFSGLQLLETLPHRPAVILTTAFDEYALRGYEFGVADYLLKPYTFERFLQAVMRVQERLQAGRKVEENTFLFVKTEYRLQKVGFDDILFIEGMRDYRRLHLRNEKIMTLETFRDLEAVLPTRKFCRVHKSYVVAIDKIESIERERIKIRQELIPISTTYRDHFYELIGRI
ncbi:response regulator [Spirosoma sp. HMF4905]|uniref:Response regulator n=1 Tax=Spirosoma arboris TaxID=2682092 RepID=A0A7K1SDB7_9BACT|nr:LytTR family DNA-binding domain-containing protein [Spirosoma arboris]MVM31783.1 response regulator [Spirosoma arboris]